MIFINKTVAFAPPTALTECMSAKIINLNATRRTLLNRIKDPDDQKSWQEFYDLYSGLVYSVALKAGLSNSEAEEVVQETFIVVSKKMPEFNYDPLIGSFKGWLLQTTRFRIMDQFRKRQPHLRPFRDQTKTRGRTATIEKIPDPAGFSLESVWDDEWKLNIRDKALERVKHQIKAKQYRIFDLYVLQGWPAEKVASTMQVTRAFVFVVKFRVMSRIDKEVRTLQAKSPEFEQNEPRRPTASL
jgi:RNA polymerase sigma factor (sigma-70 family)